MDSDDIVKKYEDILGAKTEVLVSIPSKYKEYKSRANKKNMMFTLSFIQFDTLCKLPCVYCGIKHESKVMGIDRVDNNRGYLPNNSVASCWDCNRSKSDKTLQEFKEYINRFRH